MNFLNNLMSPLGKEHCMIMYYLGLINFFLAVFVLVSAIFSLVDSKSRKDGGMLILNSFVMFFMYYIYRILYSMCVR